MWGAIGAGIGLKSMIKPQIINMPKVAKEPGTV